MIVVKELIWDEWNREHLARHEVSKEEVEEVCHGKYKAKASYRKRIQLSGETKNGRRLTIILSPEGRNLEKYEEGIYYPITAFEEVE